MADGRQKLNLKAWIVTPAVLWGAHLFFASLFAMWKINTMWFNMKAFDLLVSSYPGLNADFPGAIVGLVYGIICGGICRGLFAGLHNWIVTQIK